MTDKRPTIEELIEASSLGTPEAKALRAQTSPEDVAEVMRRLRVLQAAHDALRNDMADVMAEHYVERRGINIPSVCRCGHTYQLGEHVFRHTADHLMLLIEDYRKEPHD